MRQHRNLLLGAVSLVAMAGMTSAAQAGAFGLRTQSTNAIGAAGAGNASGMPGISSMFWNPATVTMNPGYSSEYNFTYVSPEAKIRPMAPTPAPALGLGPSGNIGQDAFVPASYLAYQVNDTVWVGLANGSLFGSITKPNDRWAGQTYSRSSRVTSLSFTPIIGVKVTDWLSIGIGPTAQYLKVRLNSASGIGPVNRNVILEGSDWGAGFTAGVTIKPFEGTTIGVGYRSSIHHEVNGTLRIPSPLLAAGVVLPVKVNLNLPEMLTVGLTQQLTPDLKVSVGFEWMNWSRLGTQGIESAFVTAGPIQAFPLAYKDGYLYSLGAEYQLTQNLAVRAGVAYEESPISNRNRSTRLPDTDRIIASVGASYDWNEKLRISASYAHYFAVGDSAIRIAPGSPLFSPASPLPFYADSSVSADIFSVSLRYRWDDPKVAAAVVPVVAKH
ncbi:outer membrane protein transport protein [Enterovirga sp.]|jgi:long-chain fatty acid transport protein|uniref:OmpP1/FadL family transporter n=1 Tax=Enterovirga sp. TaxID=2026350 RepID=UPI00262EA268|nr:outer membrane protein transport protein [Enterovirga sp.]MDB5591274.1 rane protein involved in aromatic hydrocarbon degradation [Enterovirga sp.]